MPIGTTTTMPTDNGPSKDTSLQPMNTETESNNEVNRIAIRAPPFWPEKPALWFCQLESQFHISNVTQDITKFWHVVSQLESRYAALIEDIITDPPANAKYDTLKTELIRRLSSSQQSKIKQLLEHEEVGDRTPSQFLRHLRSLAGTTVSEEFLRTLWLSRLPQDYQAILVAQSDLSLEKVSDIADKIHETRTPMQVASTSRSRQTPNEASPVNEQLVEQIKLLTTQIDKLTRRADFRSSTNRSRSREPSGTRSSQSDSPNCWYHEKYGENAQKCRPPCAFSGNERSRH